MKWCGQQRKLSVAAEYLVDSCMLCVVREWCCRLLWMSRKEEGRHDRQVLGIVWQHESWQCLETSDFHILRD
jgi:hypothetical protein